jgi:hypothetical protein
MSDDEPKEPKKGRDWDRIVGRIVKVLGVIFAVAGLVLVLVVGLALGACFLGNR